MRDGIPLATHAHLYSPLCHCLTTTHDTDSGGASEDKSDLTHTTRDDSSAFTKSNDTHMFSMLGYPFRHTLVLCCVCTTLPRAGNEGGGARRTNF